MKCPHCDTPIDEHEASRCLDAWVAEAVMGELVLISPSPIYVGRFHWTRKGEWYSATDGPKAVPEYSIDIAAAWEIIEMLRQKHILLPLWSLATLEFFPLEICRAALKAVPDD